MKTLKWTSFYDELPRATSVHQAGPPQPHLEGYMEHGSIQFTHTHLTSLKNVQRLSLGDSRLWDQEGGMARRTRDTDELIWAVGWRSSGRFRSLAAGAAWAAVCGIPLSQAIFRLWRSFDL